MKCQPCDKSAHETIAPTSQKWKRWGKDNPHDGMPIPVSSSDFSETDRKRFWGKVRMGDGCWEWMGGLSKSGYGLFQIGKRTFRAHRVSYVITHSIVLDQRLICHRCDNPKCVNPDHLFPGTAKDNIRDASGKMRLLYGTDHPRHKLSPADVIKIRELSAEMSDKKLAKIFGVTHHNIALVRQRKIWRHVA